MDLHITYNQAIVLDRNLKESIKEEKKQVSKTRTDMIEHPVLNSVMNLILRVGYKNNSCIRETQENLIKSPLQDSLSYILLQMVHARYCASYPKWPCVKHKANVWCPCCMMLLCSRIFYFFLSSPVINVVTTPSDVTDVTVWQITSNPNPRVLKIEKCKIIKRKRK